MSRRSLLFFCLLLIHCCASAHEIRPAYLMMEEQPDGLFSVLWKTPVISGYSPDIQLMLPESCNQESELFAEMRDGAIIRTWTTMCGSQALEGQSISVEGLSGTLIDVIIQISWNDGQGYQMLLTPDRTHGVVGMRQKQSRSFQFLPMGIKHILYGFDHLAFLLCILLYVRQFKPLLKTITAFTLAHSITLILVSLGAISVPGTPVEVMVAFSIVLLASEVIGNKPFSVSRGWKITFGFGLLHGLGYAGALQGIGLPEDGVLTALLLFNLGVEIGQIGFVLIVLFHLELLERIWVNSRSYVKQFSAHLVGITAVFWMIERLGRIITTG